MTLTSKVIFLFGENIIIWYIFGLLCQWWLILVWFIVIYQTKLTKSTKIFSLLESVYKHELIWTRLCGARLCWRRKVEKTSHLITISINIHPSNSERPSLCKLFFIFCKNFDWECKMYQVCTACLVLPCHGRFVAKFTHFFHKFYEIGKQSLQTFRIHVNIIISILIMFLFFFDINQT